MRLTKIIVFLSLSLILHHSLSFGQVEIKDGTTLTIANNTTVKIVADTLYCKSNEVTNDGVIHFSERSFLIEDEGKAIKGDGYETTVLKKTNADKENVSGLGLTISSDQIKDSAMITRGHLDIYPNQASILRWFEINPPLAVSYFSFYYDKNEHNNINLNKLAAFVSEGNNWFKISGTSANNNFYSSENNTIEKIVLAEDKENELSIHPSIGFDKLMVLNLPVNESVNINIYSVEGKLVQRVNFITENYTSLDVNVGHLSKGVYIISISMQNTNKIIYTKKWVKY